MESVDLPWMHPYPLTRMSGSAFHPVSWRHQRWSQLMDWRSLLTTSHCSSFMLTARNRPHFRADAYRIFFFSRRGRFLLLCRSQVDLEGNSSWNQRKWRLSGRNWRSNWNFETWKLDKCSDDDLKCRRCYQRRPHSHPVWFQQRKTHKRRRKKRELCICR